MAEIALSIPTVVKGREMAVSAASPPCRGRDASAGSKQIRVTRDGVSDFPSPSATMPPRAKKVKADPEPSHPAAVLAPGAQLTGVLARLVRSHATPTLGILRRPC